MVDKWWPAQAKDLASATTTYWAAQCIVTAVIWSLVLIGHRVGKHLRAPVWVQWPVAALSAGAAGAYVNHVLVLPLPFWLQISVWSNLDSWYYPWTITWHVTLAAMLVVAHGFVERNRTLEGLMHEAELARIAQERSSSEVHLQLLQAQVEPHFVFNALANVRRLLRTEPEGAASLLADLLRYFEESLPRLRAPHSTLGHEAELVRAYLGLHKVRMGQRLRAEVDVPDSLSHCSLPAMLLLTLVENALKHGLQPLVEGGSIHVAARARDGQLTLTVADTGVGMGSGLGGGTGLANARSRLLVLHGSDASLSLTVNEPRGVLATVSLPQVAA